MSEQRTESKSILCLCHDKHHWKFIPGYSEAFRSRGFEFVYPDEGVRLDTPLDEILKALSSVPSWIFHFESAWPLLPQGLEKAEIPTVRFDIDTYFYPRTRTRWSLLFDHVAVCHPGYDQVFRRAGHPDTLVLPHAVARHLYARADLVREYELGWVGQLGGQFYRRRQEVLPKLFRTFHTNDTSRSYTIPEVAEVYRRSRIVLNVGRDDFPEDANLRVFEALASGALLITSLPSELTALGFKEGEHFVGYEDESQIYSLVKHYLANDDRRVRVGEAGRAKVMAEHTYDNRAQALLEHLTKTNGLLAPARSWSISQTRLAYLDYFASLGQQQSAFSQYKQIVGRSFRGSIEGAMLLAKGWGRGLLSRAATSNDTN